MAFQLGTAAAVAVYTHYEWKKLEEKEKRLAKHPYFMEAKMRYRTKLQDELTTEHLVQAVRFFFCSKQLTLQPGIKETRRDTLCTEKS